MKCSSVGEEDLNGFRLRLTAIWVLLGPGVPWSAMAFGGAVVGDPAFLGASSKMMALSTTGVFIRIIPTIVSSITPRRGIYTSSIGASEPSLTHINTVISVLVTSILTVFHTITE